MEEECCPDIDISKWNDKETKWSNKTFYSMPLFLFFHMPLNFKSAIMKGFKQIEEKGYEKSDPMMLLEKENGLFTGELLFAIKTPKKADPKLRKVSGTFLSKSLKGEYKDAGKLTKELIKAATGKAGIIPKDYYYWYANCPGCAKTQGGAKIIAFARLE